MGFLHASQRKPNTRILGSLGGMKWTSSKGPLSSSLVVMSASATCCLVEPRGGAAGCSVRRATTVGPGFYPVRSGGAPPVVVLRSLRRLEDGLKVWVCACVVGRYPKLPG